MTKHESDLQFADKVKVVNYGSHFFNCKEDGSWEIVDAYPDMVGRIGYID